jgi:hypothetical protein
MDKHSTIFIKKWKKDGERGKACLKKIGERL